MYKLESQRNLNPRFRVSLQNYTKGLRQVVGVLLCLTYICIFKP